MCARWSSVANPLISVRTCNCFLEKMLHLVPCYDVFASVFGYHFSVAEESKDP